MTPAEGDYERVYKRRGAEKPIQLVPDTDPDTQDPELIGTYDNVQTYARTLRP